MLQKRWLHVNALRKHEFSCSENIQDNERYCSNFTWRNQGMFPLNELNRCKLQNRIDFVIGTVNSFLHGLESLIKNIEKVIVRLKVNYITFRI